MLDICNTFAIESPSLTLYLLPDTAKIANLHSSPIIPLYVTLFVIQMTYKSQDDDEWIRDHPATPPYVGGGGVSVLGGPQPGNIFSLKTFGASVSKGVPVRIFSDSGI